MAFEAMPRKGELSLRDLRSVYGSGLRAMADVDVLVLSEDEGAPVAARIELAESSWGWSHRTLLVCPTCRERKHALVARDAKLQCIACHGQLTRQQREKRRANWVRRSGREEDRLLRLLRPAVEPSTTRVAEARGLVRDIVSADRARVEELQRQLSFLSAALEARS